MKNWWKNLCTVVRAIEDVVKVFYFLLNWCMISFETIKTLFVLAWRNF